MTEQHGLRAIETRYAGCRFRSRLEARWAVFLDALGAKWEYEPEGVNVAGRPYLPDFYLPEHRFYVEVKGDVSQMTMDYEVMLHRLVLEADPKRVAGLIVLGQVPDISDRKAPLHTAFVKKGVQTGPDDRAVETFVSGVMLASSFFMDGGYVMPLSRWFARDLLEAKSVGYIRLSQKVGDAYVAARSARFEHGEAGA